MKVGRLMFIVALMMLTVALASCAAATPTPSAPAQMLKFSMSANDSSSWYKGAARFADLVKQRTNGRIAISVFPDGSLSSGDQVKELQMLGEGGIDFLYTGVGQYTNLDPRYNVVALPWLFTSNADVDKALSGPMGQELLQVAEAKGIVGLAWGENGWRQISNNKREIKTPDDVKGLKMRIPATKVYESTFVALGASTTTVNLSATYAALQSGSMDGQDMPVDLFISNKFYDVQKYMTIWNYSYSSLLLGANKKMFDSLDANTQKIIRQAAMEASAYQVTENRKMTDSQLQLLKDKGMTVTTLTPEQIKAFKDRVASVYAEFEPIVGKEFMNKYVPVAK